jgi:hypothetical protein
LDHRLESIGEAGCMINGPVVRFQATDDCSCERGIVLDKQDAQSVVHLSVTDTFISTDRFETLS